VLPALIRKFHEAKLRGDATVTVWGSGNPRREFLHVDDLADAALFLMQHYESEAIINIGVGKDLSIRELAQLVKTVVKYPGQIEFDTSKPDGTMQKLLDISRLQALGWQAQIALRAGIESTYQWYLNHQNQFRQQ
jgi:GDP-L-fucose synthase